MKKKKPCPFCGESDRKKLKTLKGPCHLQIECFTCRSRGPLVEFYDELTPYWNLRFEPECLEIKVSGHRD